MRSLTYGKTKSECRGLLIDTHRISTCLRDRDSEIHRKCKFFSAYRIKKINKFNLLRRYLLAASQNFSKIPLLHSIFSRETHQFSQGPHAVTCKCNLLSLEKPRMRGFFLNVGLYSKWIREAHIKEMGSLCFHPLHEENETPVYCFLEEYSDFQTIEFFSAFYWDFAKGTKTKDSLSTHENLLVPLSCSIFHLEE